MQDIVAIFATFQAVIGRIAGFGVNDSYSAASFSILLIVAGFGAVCINHMAERHSAMHVTVNLTAMFGGAVAGNAFMRGLNVPLGHELLVTATLALCGMAVMGMMLLFTYRRTDI